MSLFQVLRVNISKRGGDVLKICSSFVHNSTTDKEKVIRQIQKKAQDDMPVKIENPFAREKPKCILCKYDIEPDFKNVRLLSQFVSRFTGRVYGRHITGICEHKHKKLENEIKKAQISGLMGCYVKEPKYLQDPVLYNVEKPFRVV